MEQKKLIYLNNQDDIDKFLKRLDDEDDEVVKKAIEEVRGFEIEEIITKLLEKLDSEDSEIVNRVRNTLSYIDRKKVYKILSKNEVKEEKVLEKEKRNKIKTSLKEDKKAINKLFTELGGGKNIISKEDKNFIDIEEQKAVDKLLDNIKIDVREDNINSSKIVKSDEKITNSKTQSSKKKKSSKINNIERLKKRIIEEFGVKASDISSKKKFEDYVEKNIFKLGKRDDWDGGDWFDLYDNGTNNKIDIFCECVYELKLKKKDYDFTDYVFPRFNFFDNDYNSKYNIFKSKKNRVIDADLIFKNAIFFEDLDLSNIIFNGDVSFNGATFEKDVDFSSSKIKGISDFNKTIYKGETFFNQVVFIKEATFLDGVFEKKVNFGGSTFEKDAIFRRGMFYDDTDFQNVEFKLIFSMPNTTFNKSIRFSDSRFFGKTSFVELNFNGNVYFDYLVFNDNVNFGNSKFKNEVNFDKTIFNKDCNFVGSLFRKIPWFGNVEFNKNAYFSSIIFEEGASFRNSRFKGEGSFLGTKFNKGSFFDDCEFCGEALFNGANFHGETNFKNIKLMQNSKNTTKLIFYTAIISNSLIISGADLGDGTKIVLDDVLGGNKIDLSNINWKRGSLTMKNLVTDMLLIDDIYQGFSECEVLFSYVNYKESYKIGYLECLLSDLIILKKFYLERGMFEEEDNSYFYLKDYKRWLDRAEKERLSHEDTIDKISLRGKVKVVITYFVASFGLGNGIRLWRFSIPTLLIPYIFTLITGSIIFYTNAGNEMKKVGNDYFDIEVSNFVSFYDFIDLYLINFQQLAFLQSINDFQANTGRTRVLYWIFTLEGVTGIVLIAMFGTFLARKVIR